MKTDFLFAQPSLWVGIGRLIDICGLMDDYNRSHTEEEADARGLYSDWRITGEDISRALQTAKEEDAAQQAALQMPLFADRETQLQA